MSMFFFFFNLCFYSYQILSPKELVGVGDPKKCAQIILDATSLDPDMFRLGNTKACLF